MVDGVSHHTNETFFPFFKSSSTLTRAARHWIVAHRGSSQGERGFTLPPRVLAARRVLISGNRRPGLLHHDYSTIHQYGLIRAGLECSPRRLQLYSKVCLPIRSDPFRSVPFRYIWSSASSLAFRSAPTRSMQHTSLPPTGIPRAQRRKKQNRFRLRVRSRAIYMACIDAERTLNGQETSSLF